MQKKQSESDFAKMMGELQRKTDGFIWAHKWADIRFCPHCHGMLYKTENNVDYQLVVGPYVGLVECKQDSLRFSFADPEKGIRNNQRELLNKAESFSRKSWLFLELGDGRAPKAREAWLIPWVYWVFIEQTIFQNNNRKSIAWKKSKRSEGANTEDLLKLWKLEWVQNEGFKIPKDHIFWEIYRLEYLE